MRRFTYLPLFFLLGLATILGVLLSPTLHTYDTDAEAAATYDKRATSSSLSNAERMARGLPLNAPRFLYEPSRTRTLLPRTSNIVTTPYYIEAAYANDPNTIVGYLMSPSSTVFIKLVSITSEADTYYAPANVPAYGANIKTDSLAYGTTFPYLAGGAVGQDSGHHSGDQAADFQVSDFPELDIGFYPSRFEQRLYISPTDLTLYGGHTADSINSVEGTTITDADKVYLNFVAQ